MGTSSGTYVGDVVDKVSGASTSGAAENTTGGVAPDDTIGTYYCNMSIGVGYDI